MSGRITSVVADTIAQATAANERVTSLVADTIAQATAANERVTSLVVDVILVQGGSAFPRGYW